MRHSAPYRPSLGHIPRTQRQSWVHNLGVHQRDGTWVNLSTELFKLCDKGIVRDLQPRGCAGALDLQQQGHTSEHPLGRVFLRFQVKSPHVGWPSLACFVQRTRVHAPGVLFVSRNGLDEHDRHGRGQLLEPGVRDYPALQGKGDKAVVRFPRCPSAAL